jgi:hypothetical protein
VFRGDGGSGAGLVVIGGLAVFDAADESSGDGALKRRGLRFGEAEFLLQQFDDDFRLAALRFHTVSGQNLLDAIG